MPVFISRLRWLVYIRNTPSCHPRPVDNAFATPDFSQIIWALRVIVGYSESEPERTLASGPTSRWEQLFYLFIYFYFYSSAIAVSWGQLVSIEIFGA